MMMDPAPLEAESTVVVRAVAPRQGKPILRLRGEPQKQARTGYASRARKKEAEATRLKAATDADANAGLEKNEAAGRL